MKWTQLKAIAKRNGIVRWTRSGVLERLSIWKKKVMAKGPASPSHFIRNGCDAKQEFYCVEVSPKATLPIGEILYPTNAPHQFIHQEHLKTQRDIANILAREREKRDLKICRGIMES
jgi:hypothetical protein